MCDSVELIVVGDVKLGRHKACLGVEDEGNGGGVMQRVTKEDTDARAIFPTTMFGTGRLERVFENIGRAAKKDGSGAGWVQ